MNKNVSEKGLNAEQFFDRSRIRTEEAVRPDSAFSEELKQKLSSRHLFINGEHAPASMKERILILFKSKAAVIMLCCAFGLFVLFAAVFLFVPSFRDSVSATAAKLLGRDKQEQPKTDEHDIKGEQDTKAPKLEIVSPAKVSETTEAKVKVEGMTDKEVKVTINGVSVDTNEGKFGKELELTMGENKIIVEAFSSNGKSTTKELVVTRTEVKTTEVTSTPKPTDKPKTGSLTLVKGTAIESGIKLEWAVSNLDTSKGFKVIWSKDNSNPAYPGNDAQLVDGSARNTIINKKDGKKYYFRVCQYLGDGKCGMYSNSIQVVAPSAPAFTVTGLTLNNGDGTAVNWAVTGNAVNGYKLLWSKTNSTPIYGGDGVSGQGIGAGSTSGNIGNSEPGTYYVRLCAKNNDGGCFYSNTVTKEIL